MYRRLWLLAVILSAWSGAVVASGWILPAGMGLSVSALGYDFYPFYAAASLAREGRMDQAYDLAIIYQRELQLAALANQPWPAEQIGPWWNPPHAVGWFLPLTAFDFLWARWVWWGAMSACLLAVGFLLGRLVRNEISPLPREWLLAPVLLICSFPAIQSLGHGQNTMLSLALLTLTAMLWRRHRALLAGVCCGLLFYKPQTAALVAAVLVATLGWRALLGVVLCAGAQAILALLLLPGATEAWLLKLSSNLQFMQFERPYPWDRHATLLGFWRTIFQGTTVGPHELSVRILAVGSQAMVALMLLVCIVRSWHFLNRVDVLDGLIALTLVCTPLISPFFFDYDLLLLSVAATLMARDLAWSDRDALARWTIRTWVALAILLTIHPALLGVNLSVPLLLVLAILSAARVLQRVTRIGKTGAVVHVQVARRSEAVVGA